MGCRVLQGLISGVAALAVVPCAANAAPVADDFERPLGEVQRMQAKAAGHAGEGPVTHRSGVVSAPASFDAVGLAGELRPVEIRAHETGGRWSEWIEIAQGDPLYVVGGADAAQLRTRGWRPRGRLHFVSISETGDATGRDKARGVKETPRPEFISRRRWGAEGSGGCPPRTDPLVGRTKAVAVHHTVTSNDYSRSEAKGIVLAICRYHRNGNGWNDIGYNALVDRFGRLYEGRAGGVRKSIVGAHAEGFNSQTSGIASIANHTDFSPSDGVLHMLGKFAAWKLSVNGIRANGEATMVSGGGSTNRYPEGERIRTARIIGHRRVSATSCPGDRLNSKLERIRKIAARIQQNAR